MRTEQVDPRDVTVEIHAPAYRVVLWDERGGADVWELTEADLDEVLAWIPAHRGARTHSLWAVHDILGDVTAVRLQGVDADRDDGPAWARTHRG